MIKALTISSLLYKLHMQFIFRHSEVSIPYCVISQNVSPLYAKEILLGMATRRLATEDLYITKYDLK